MRARTPLVIVAVGVALTLVVAVPAVMAILRGRAPHPPAAPRLARDPVPKPLRVTTVPEDCGVPAATLRALVPKAWPDARGPGACAWDAFDDHRARHLRVGIDLSGADKLNGDTPASAAMSAYDKAEHEDSGRPGRHRTVTGLGDEASAAYRAYGGHHEARVAFRAGNAVVRVRYWGTDPSGSGETPLPQAAARSGALAAAAAGARTLGSPHRHPRLAGPAPGPPPITRRLDACALLPDDVRERYVPDLVTGPGRPWSNDVPLPGLANSTCGWFSDDVQLNVAVAAGRSTEPGAAVRSATREFLRRHDDGRSGGGFDALRGPGDQAFTRRTTAALMDLGDPGLGQVVFRVRNVLVTVEYGNQSSEPGDPLTYDQEANGAYAIAATLAHAIKP